MKHVLFYGLIGLCIIFEAACYSPPVQPSGEQISVEPDEEMESIGEDIVFLELPPVNADLPVSTFREVWAYLVADREQALNNNFPITDLVYFGAEVDAYGKLVNIPNFRNISSFRGRKHFVASCNGRALSYFVLAEGRPERDALIQDLLEAARPYDGLQINFEYVPARSGAAYLSFLRELRAGLGNKVFSVAIAARTRTLQDDVYDYGRILPIVDRILVMAYDEHWSTSAPGPIASMPWSQRVARYSLDTIGPEKLIMGLPFYGRTWGDVNPNRAFYHVGIQRIHGEQGSPEISRENGIPTFKYETNVSITVYYEDAYSLATRMDMYKNMGVNAVGFWRLGQETPEVWPQIRLE